jgi:hypothetical protein
MPKKQKGKGGKGGGKNPPPAAVAASKAVAVSDEDEDTDSAALAQVRPSVIVSLRACRLMQLDLISMGATASILVARDLLFQLVGALLCCSIQFTPGLLPYMLNGFRTLTI